MRNTMPLFDYNYNNQFSATGLNPSLTAGTTPTASSFNPSAFATNNTNTIGSAINPTSTPTSSSTLPALNLQNVATGLNALSGITQAYTGLQQLSLARDSFAFNRDLATTNLSNQARTVNTQLEDRQVRRLDAQGRDYSSLSSYLQKSRVSGTVGG